MRNLIDFSFMHEYNKNVLPRGDKLLSIAGLVEWKRFSHIENFEKPNQWLSLYTIITI